MRTNYFSAALTFSTALATACLPSTASASAVVDSDALSLVARGTIVGDVAADKIMGVALLLNRQDEAGLDDFLRHVGKPGDPLYRHYLTPAQFADRFGAPADAAASVAAWAKSQGLTVSEVGAGRTMVVVRGSASRIGAVFGVHFSNYRAASDGHITYAADAAPRLPQEVASRVSAALGFSEYRHFASLARVKPANVPNIAGGTGPGGAYSASDLRAAYAVAKQTPATRTQTVALYEEGGYDPNDVTVYQTFNNLRAVPVTPRLVNGYGGGVNDPGIEIESVLDIDMITGLNDQVKQVLVYEDGDDSFGVSLLACLDAIASDDVAQTVSISYGLDEVLMGEAQILAEHKVLKQVAAEGIAVFVSAGDSGAYGDSGRGLNVLDPEAQPLVTSVGGTTLFTGPKQAYFDEEVWNQLASGGGATGGGVSAVWPIPSWQIANGTSVAAPNGGSSTMRNVPDVAADASPFTGVAVYSKINGGWVQIGGTSAASPIWAGFFSSVNASSQALGLGSIGFFNPSLYAFAETPEGGLRLHDIVDGSNGNAEVFGIPGFNAGFGYDNTVGWGSLTGSSFLTDYLVDTVFTSSGPKPPSAVTGLSATPSAGNIRVSWNRSAEATGYLVVALNRTKQQKVLYAITSGATSVTLAPALASSTYDVEVFAVDPTGAAENNVFVITPAKTSSTD